MMALRLDATVRSGAETSPEVMLQASRRVDWRFLLPDPSLGDVAFIGNAQGSLADTLKMFSVALTVSDASELTPRSLYDVVVTVDPTVERLECAARWLRPGGWLYVEVHGPSLRGPLRFARDYMAALKKLGFDEVEAHWHWPDFESCIEIVPLGSQTALLEVFARHRSGGKGWLKSVFGRLLLRTGLLIRVIPCYSLVARKTG
jgi:hypothetical protein